MKKIHKTRSFNLINTIKFTLLFLIPKMAFADAEGIIAAPIETLIDYLTGYIGVTFFVAIIAWRGFVFMTTDDPGEAKAEKKVFVRTLIGSAILFGAATVADAFM